MECTERSVISKTPITSIPSLNGVRVSSLPPPNVILPPVVYIFGLRSTIWIQPRQRGELIWFDSHAIHARLQLQDGPPFSIVCRHGSAGGRRGLTRFAFRRHEPSCNPRQARDEDLALARRLRGERL